MSKQRDKRRARRDADWEARSREQVKTARKNIGLEDDQYIPDEFLALEADHYLPRSNPTGSLHHTLEGHEQWAGFRLIGIADTEEGRQTLADRLSAAYSINPHSGGTGKGHRRSARSGRRHNRNSHS